MNRQVIERVKATKAAKSVERITARLQEIEVRLVRIETRLCKLCEAMDVEIKGARK